MLRGLFPALVLGWIDPSAIEELGVHRFHVMGIALFATMALELIATQLYRPRDHPGALLAAVAIFATVAVVQVVTGDDPMLAVFLGVPAAVGLLLHPAGWEMFDRQRHSLLWVLVLAAAIPLVACALAQANLQFAQPLSDPHAEKGHYGMMANLGFALVIAGLVAASGLPGWRITSRFAGVGMTYFGIQSIAMPSQIGAVSTVWSSLAIVWGIAFVVAAEYSRREDVSDLVSRP